MTWTWALTLFAFGLVTGTLLSGPLGRLATWLRKVFYKPVMLRPFSPGKTTSASPRQEQDDRDQQA
ncbi:MAG: hypothetical protein KJ852_00405 [Gammaproteobacteria bacterium]|jgi:hypothetical protein|nr:hypothetical protein [Gammaproteobacteria bacterium]MBU0788011.1 hypothetical protein [Gammaproteobacteria bacterium]MBU0815491.1 hypothetical protein [Gammaproteobacteria bacterium]MBU1785401.1 hypothetical protein [Gammaproteobacteria bacterium]